MDTTSSKPRGAKTLAGFRSLRSVLAALAVVPVLFTASGSTIAAAGGENIVGTWSVRVTLRNCDTGAALTSFDALVTFGRGGTIVESAATLSFAPGQRTNAHGTWSRAGGHTYAQKMVALILFGSAPNPPVSPGFEAGWQTVEHTVELVDRDHLESSGRNYFFRSNGELYRSGCSTAVGIRFE
jgi:hypothetical protein